MSGSRVGLNQLLAYYSSQMPPNWFSHVTTTDDLCDVLRRARDKGIDIPSIDKASAVIAASGDQDSDPVTTTDESEPAVGSAFRYSTRVVHWDDLRADHGQGNALSFGNHGSVWINDEYRVVMENTGPGCAVLAAYAPRAKLGGLLVLPHILDMESKRIHHLAQIHAKADASLFQVRGNDSVFHLQADVADMIGAQKCLYSLEMYKFIKGFAKQGIGMGEIKAAFLFIDGSKSSNSKYGTPPPQIQQFIGAAVMLGIRISRLKVVSASDWPSESNLAFDPALQGLLLGDKVILDIANDEVLDMRLTLKKIMRFRDELSKLVGSRKLRERIWTYHVPMAIATSYGSQFSLGARFRTIKQGARKHPPKEGLAKWLVSKYALWQQEVPRIV